MRLIGSDGAQLGVLSVEAALQRAADEGLDLVEISPMARPPVCKIMDYGKFKYEAKRKASEAKKKQVVVQLKEVKLRPKTDEHDYAFKVKNVRRFLEEGNKARVTIMFRGREITHKEIGQKILQSVAEDVKEVGVIEQPPRQEGRQMFMILAPNPKYKAQLREAARAAGSEKPEKEKTAKELEFEAQKAAERAAEKAARGAAARAANEAARAAAGGKAQDADGDGESAAAEGSAADGEEKAASSEPGTPAQAE